FNVVFVVGIFLTSVGGVLSVKITPQLITSVSGARQRYNLHLDNEKRKAAESSKAIKRKSTIDELDNLKRAKKRCIADIMGLEKSSAKFSDQAETTAVNITFLHTNDVHTRIEQASLTGSTCTSEMAADDMCFGGIARRATVVSKIRRENETNVLLLDAGDEFQGTMWYYVYRGLATSHFMNMLQYDAMSLGNHEFDDGISGLLPFLENVTFPILSSNINADDEVKFQQKISKSVILLVEGTKMGIIGYTLSTTPDFSKTGKLTFEDEVDAVQSEVNRLLASNVTIIVAVGHSGIEVDLDIANRVTGLDVVIGGHTNTFLYTGSPPPSSETPFDVYPITVRPDYDTTRTVLVVSAYAYGKYLGRLDVTFSEEGDVKAYTGNPILLDHIVQPDPTIASEVSIWAKKVTEVSEDVIGQSFVTLEADACKVRECSYGNLITDAMVADFLKTPNQETWSNASIAMTTAGSIQSSIKPGQVTVANIRSTFPYGNTIDVIELKGKHLLQTLEHSVIEHNNQTGSGDFLQVSGIRVAYDVTRSPGERITDVQVRCSRCTEPAYVQLNTEEVYSIITNSYIAGGGGGFDVIKETKLSQTKGRLDMDIMIDYIGNKSPITTGLESRITITYEGTSSPHECNSAMTSSFITTWTVLICLGLYSLLLL
ncbi:snake venom 5'-nucleotidase-like, partial [Antedon mediterranea]|uniref:snake venom 5'-nucleotidase-like n=1 Tax=Antedon mediterranea TaxID=105859 RepID=UPI003AF45AE1